MYISEVVKRLEELRRVESDIHIVISGENSLDPIEEVRFDVYTNEDGERKILVYPGEPLEQLELLSTKEESDTQEETTTDQEERVYEEQPLRETVHERRTRQSRERSKE